MRLVCPECRLAQPVRQVSPDFVRANAKEFFGRAIRVVYSFGGVVADAFWLSPEFALQNHVIGGEVELPDLYPEWTERLVYVCDVCYSSGVPSE